MLEKGSPRVGIAGAGAVGGYLAIALAAGGAEVVLVGRRRIDDPLEMRLIHRDGRELQPRGRLTTTHGLAALADSEIVLVAVKAQDTDAVGAALAEVIAPETPVVSFQNGLFNTEVLRERLPNPVLGGVVGFNVAREGPVRRQLTRGPLLAERAPGLAGARVRALAKALRGGGVRLELRRDIRECIAGKLLVNLGNGVAAVTGLGTQALLSSRDARFCYAQCIREGLLVLRAADLRPASVMLLSPAHLARALLLPDAIVAPLARAIAGIDPKARASTLADLDAGDSTEIDELNGAIARLGESTGRGAPVNHLITDLVHAHERAGAARTFVPSEELRRRIEPLLQTSR